MAKYGLRIDDWDCQNVLGREHSLADCDSPMAALSSIADLFEQVKGFDSTNTVECYDLETGVKQWVLTIC